MNANTIEGWLATAISAKLKMDEEQMDRTLPFSSLGLDSLVLLTLTGELAEMLGRDLSPSLVWEYPTIETLARHLATQSVGAPDGLIPCAPRDRPLPLSFAQERIWRHARKDGEGDSNLIVRRYILNGTLNVDALRHSLTEVIRRHEILRTTFSVVEGEPVRSIHPPAHATLSLTDLTVESKPADEALRLLVEAWRPMNLERGPLLRTMLFRLAESEHRLVFVLHHLLFDATSLPVFFDELSAHYSAYCAGAGSPLTEPALQAADFAVWQRDWLRRDGEPYQRRLAWWKEYWRKPMPPVLELPFRRASPSETPGVGNRGIEWEVSPALVDQVKDLGRREDATSYVCFLAVFESLLYQLTGLEDMIIGTYVSDRSRIAAKNALGCYIDLMPLRARLSGQPTFLEVLHRTRDTLRETSIHQGLPFEELVRGLQDEGGEVPCIQVIFNQIQDPGLRLKLPGLAIQRWVSELPPGRGWGVTLRIVEATDKLKAVLEFDDGLYDPAGMAEMLQQYEALLGTIVADPDHRICPSGVVPNVSSHLSDHETTDFKRSAGKPRDRSSLLRRAWFRGPD